MNGGSRQELIRDILSDREFRHFWSETYLRESIPFQMKTLRTERGLRQIDAAELLGKGQNGLSRLESPAYGKLSLQTLLDVARGYDVGLIVKFVPFSRLLKEYDDVSFEALSAPSPDAEKFPEELLEIEKWANEGVDGGLWEAESNVEVHVLKAPIERETGSVHTSPKFATEPVIQTAAPTHTLPFPIGLRSTTDPPAPQKFRDVAVTNTNTRVTKSALAV